jgi:chondroitin AC lyase
LHDQIGYYFPEKCKLRLETKMVVGSWYRVATHYPDETMTSRIFNLWFDHGKNPSNESYCYILIPNASKVLLQKMENEAPFKIHNTVTLQEVVAIDGTLARAVFYQPGTSKALGVTTNKPCLVMMERDKEGIRISASDPTQKLEEIELIIEGNFESADSSVKDGQTILDVKLPRGGEAGKTVSFALKKI